MASCSISAPHRLSEQLVGVRRLQAVGRLRRRTADGDPYWVEE